MEMAHHDYDMEFEEELEVDYLAERVIAVAASGGEVTDLNIGDLMQQPLGMVVRRPAVSAMTDAQMTKCMKPITVLGKFNHANPCTISVTAPTLHLAAQTVIDILQYGNSSLPDRRFNSPPGVTVSDISQCEPIGFLDVRTSYEVFVIQNVFQIEN